MADLADFTALEDSTGAYLPSDVSEAQKMQPYAVSQSMPWWESLITFGPTRAIDNALGIPPNVLGNTGAGYFSGANGQTYTQTPTGAGGGTIRTANTTQTTGAAGGLFSSPLVPIALVAIVGVALFVHLRK